MLKDQKEYEYISGFTYDFHGFRSLRAYEQECARFGYPTFRVPFRRGEEQFIAFVVGSPQRTSTSVCSWELFTADEKTYVLNGIISGGTFMSKDRSAEGPGYAPDGVDVNWLGLLGDHDIFPADPVNTPVDPSAPLYYSSEGQLCIAGLLLDRPA